jgi:hypothetical protein
MSKKYIISNINSDSNNDGIIYLFYIILFFIIIFFIRNFLYSDYFIDSFANVSSEQIKSESNIKSDELDNLKNKLKQQNRDLYIYQNFNKIDPSSFDIELGIIKNDFYKTDLPGIDVSKYVIINSQPKLDLIINQCSSMKNYYKPGEIVTANSSLSIDKNNICYRSKGKPLDNINEVSKNYPDCMVCSVLPDSDVNDSNSWKHTKTNIDKVCLFNTNAPKDSNIPDLNQCKKFCSL